MNPTYLTTCLRLLYDHLSKKRGLTPKEREVLKELRKSYLGENEGNDGKRQHP